MFLMGDATVGLKLLQEALRLDPDSHDIKQSFKIARKVKECLEMVEKKIFSRNFSDALNLLSFSVDHLQPLPPKVRELC
jgi:hypothetical protein